MVNDMAKINNKLNKRNTPARKAPNMKGKPRVKVAYLAEARYPRTAQAKVTPAASDELIFEFEEVAMICTVPATTSPAQYVVLRPGSSGMKRLDQFGLLYDQYRIEKCEIIYRSQVSANTNGLAVVAVDYNSSDIPQSFAETQQQLPRVVGKVWEDMRMTVPTNRLMKSQWHYTATNTGDSGFGPACNINFHSTGVNGTVVGSVWVKYRVRFSGPSTKTMKAPTISPFKSGSVQTLGPQNVMTGLGTPPAKESGTTSQVRTYQFDDASAQLRLGEMTTKDTDGKDKFTVELPGVSVAKNVPVKWNYSNDAVVEATADFMIPANTSTTSIPPITAVYDRPVNVVGQAPDKDPEVAWYIKGIWKNFVTGVNYITGCVRVVDYFGNLVADGPYGARFIFSLPGGTLVFGTTAVTAYISGRLRPATWSLGRVGNMITSGTLKNRSGTRYYLGNQEIAEALDELVPVGQVHTEATLATNIQQLNHTISKLAVVDEDMLNTRL